MQQLKPTTIGKQRKNSSNISTFDTDNKSQNDFSWFSDILQIKSKKLLTRIAKRPKERRIKDVLKAIYKWRKIKQENKKISL